MNAKHQFKYTYTDTDIEEISPVDVTFDMPGDVTITQMLFNFECYLKACGFVFDGRLEMVEDGYENYLDELDGSLYEFEDEPQGGCMADWDTEDDEDASCCGKKPAGECCGNNEHYTDEWNEGTKNLAKDLKEQRDIREKASNRADELEQFNEHWEKLTNEQRQKCLKEALKMSGL
jgi:hypothetical protein